MEGDVLIEDFQFSREPIGYEGQELLFMTEGEQKYFYNGKSYIIFLQEMTVSNDSVYSGYFVDVPAGTLD